MMIEVLDNRVFTCKKQITITSNDDGALSNRVSIQLEADIKFESI